METKTRYIWALTRIALGLVFLWAFLDKVFGLGFATTPDKSWLAGGSPTLGYLKFATAGPFAGLYQALSGNPIIDVLFMGGLLGLGLALILGIGMKIAAYGGGVLMLLLWSSHLPPENHPFLDEHIIYALTLLGLNGVHAGETWGLGRWWAGLPIVKRFPWLQ